MSRDRWNERYRERTAEELSRQNIQLEKLASKLKPGKALDLAAGDGRNSLFLARKGWEVTAVDFSEAGIKRGRAFAGKEGLSIEWIVRDLTEYVPPQNIFDLVCIFYLHIPQDQLAGILKRAAAALKPGASLLVVGHDRTNIAEGAGGPQNPDILYTPDGIASLLPSLAIDYADRIRCPVDHGELPPGSEQIDCVVRAICPL